MGTRRKKRNSTGSIETTDPRTPTDCEGIAWAYHMHVPQDEVKAFLEEQSADPLPSLTPVEKRKGSPADPEDQRPAKTRPPIAAEQHEFKLSQDRSLPCNPMT